MQEKAVWARRLLAQGLTITQVSGQLRCSRTFVRHVAKDLQASDQEQTEDRP